MMATHRETTPSKSDLNHHYKRKKSSGLSILTQLRVGFSRLNFHKFMHNFSDTMNQLCPINDGVEDREHYFLLCHMYDDIRRDLLNGVNAILLPHGMGNLLNDELGNILGVIHLVRTHEGGRGGSSKCVRMRTRGEGG